MDLHVSSYMYHLDIYEVGCCQSSYSSTFQQNLTERGMCVEDNMYNVYKHEAFWYYFLNYFIFLFDLLPFEIFDECLVCVLVTICKFARCFRFHSMKHV